MKKSGQHRKCNFVNKLFPSISPVGAKRNSGETQFWKEKMQPFLYSLFFRAFLVYLCGIRKDNQSEN